MDATAREVIGEVQKGPWIFENGKVSRPKEYKGDDVEFKPTSNGVPKPSANGVDVVVRGSDETDISSLHATNGNEKVVAVPVEPREVGVVNS